MNKIILILITIFSVNSFADCNINYYKPKAEGTRLSEIGTKLASALSEKGFTPLEIIPNPNQTETQKYSNQYARMTEGFLSLKIIRNLHSNKYVRMTITKKGSFWTSSSCTVRIHINRIFPSGEETILWSEAYTARGKLAYSCGFAFGAALNIIPRCEDLVGN